MMFAFYLISLAGADAHAFVNTTPGAVPILVRPGYVSKLKCSGRLFASAVGNEKLILLEALPKETGCGVLLKPLALEGQTNIVLETSIGTITRLIRIQDIKTGKKDNGDDHSALPSFSVEVMPDEIAEIDSSERGEHGKK